MTTLLFNFSNNILVYFIYKIMLRSGGTGTPKIDSVYQQAAEHNENFVGFNENPMSRRGNSYHSPNVEPVYEEKKASKKKKERKPRKPRTQKNKKSEAAIQKQLQKADENIAKARELADKLKADAMDAKERAKAAKAAGDKDYKKIEKEFQAKGKKLVKGLAKVVQAKQKYKTLRNQHHMSPLPVVTEE